MTRTATSQAEVNKMTMMKTMKMMTTVYRCGWTMKLPTMLMLSLLV